tara:strand:- start:28 stop:540 length:513 start_codon:yes stop_codon:yes gene_type:complete
MTGEFTSKAQAKKDTNYSDISLKVTRIWENKIEEVWLYVERANSNNLKQPYRQHIYQLVELSEYKYVSYIYDIPDKEKYIGANKKPTILDDLSSEDLLPLEDCGMGMHYAKKAFRGATAARCPNSWSGAALETSEMELYKDKLISWDRGWTEEGDQVWGPTIGAHIFIKK